MKKVMMGNEDDRISALPDSVLVHILSFLPTKHAVGTSILSTRWKFLWASVPNLDFDYALLFHPKNDWASFMNFVDRVLLFHDLSCIQKFRFKCDQDIDFSRLNAWVSVAIRRRVQELDVDVCPCMDEFLYVPRSLFTCKTLVVLKLRTELKLEIPSSVDFPSLKTLHLSLNFWCNELTQKLFCNCPVLEDLFIEGYIEDYRKVIFNIFTPALKSLVIDLTTSGFYYFENEIVIDAPILKYLTLRDNFLACYLLKNLCSLVKAEVNIGDCCIHHVGTKEQANEVFDILKEISNVKFLSFGPNTMGALDFADDNNLPMFPNLTHLELSVHDCYRWKRLPGLLKSVPNLKVLLLKKDLDLQHPTEEFIWIPPHEVPTCLLLHLKEIKTTGFKGRKDELKLVEYFLKNAQVLNKMTIDSIKLAAKEEINLSKKLLMFPRGSKTCQIEFP